MNRASFTAVAGMLLISAFAPAAMAQAPTSSANPGVVVAPPHEGQLQKLIDLLQLSPTQQAEVKQYLKAQREKIKPIRQDTTLTPAQQAAEIKPIRQATMAQIKSILTPAQLATLNQYQQSHRGGAHGAANTNPGPAQVPAVQ